MTAAEEDFVNEMTKQLLVEWGRTQLEKGQVSAGPGPWLDHAVAKGWVSKGGDRVLASGFKVAAAYLRR